MFFIRFNEIIKKIFFSILFFPSFTFAKKKLNRQFIKGAFQWLLLLIAVSCDDQLYADQTLVVPGSNWNDLQQQQPQYISNRTCNAHRLYAMDTHTHYDHFAKERCGRYVSHLIIRRSVIRYIPSNFFIHKTSFEYLITLKMENVSLKLIEATNFENITHLEVLKLPSNQIEHLPAGLFQYLTDLQTLDLSNNLISTIDSDAFRDCKNLQNLHMNFNHLTVLNGDWFRDMKNVKLVDFSDNLIESDFDGDIFYGAAGLQLFLRSNRIKRIISFGSKSERAIYRLIDLSGNTLRPPYPVIPMGNHNMSVIY